MYRMVPPLRWSALGQDPVQPSPDLDKRKMKLMREELRAAVDGGVEFLDPSNWDDVINEAEPSVTTQPGPLMVDGEEVPMFPNNEMGRALYRVWLRYEHLGKPFVGAGSVHKGCAFVYSAFCGRPASRTDAISACPSEL